MRFQKLQAVKNAKTAAKELGRYNGLGIATEAADSIVKESIKTLVKHGVKQSAKLAKKAMDGDDE